MELEGFSFSGLEKRSAQVPSQTLAEFGCLAAFRPLTEFSTGKDQRKMRMKTSHAQVQDASDLFRYVSDSAVVTARFLTCKWVDCTQSGGFRGASQSGDPFHCPSNNLNANSLRRCDYSVVHVKLASSMPVRFLPLQ